MPNNQKSESEHDENKKQAEANDQNWNLRKPDIIIEDNDGDPDSDE